MSLGYDLQGRETKALEIMDRALALGFSDKFIYTFADLAPLAKLLHTLHKHKKAHSTVDKYLNTYQQSIMVATEQSPARTNAMEEMLVHEGLGPLTRHELKILRLLDTDLTNMETARELVVATETVKLHTRHNFRKLV